MTTLTASSTAEHVVEQKVCHVATNALGDVAWLGAGPAVKVLTSKLVPVVGFDAGTSGTHATSFAVGTDTLAIVSATTLELYSLAGRTIAELDLPESSGFTRAAFTGDGQTLVWARSDEGGSVLAVQFIDATTGEVTGEATLPCAEGIESCSAFPAGARGVVVVGWEPDGEHCNVVARADADAATLTAVKDAEELSVLGVAPGGGVALGLLHGSAELYRLDLANGRVRPWLQHEPSEDDDDGANGALLELNEGSGATFLDERLALLTSEYQEPLLLDVGTDDGSPRLLKTNRPLGGPRFVCRLGARAFLTVDVHEEGARFRAWEV